MNTILVIEDDAIMGESLAQRFELEGLRVNWCRRLAEARDPLDRLPSAIVSDVRLPDGLATEWFVDLPDKLRSLPWFFLTGYGSVNDAVTAVRAGAREYLTSLLTSNTWWPWCTRRCRWCRTQKTLRC